MTLQLTPTQAQTIIDCLQQGQKKLESIAATNCYLLTPKQRTEMIDKAAEIDELTRFIKESKNNQEL